MRNGSVRPEREQFINGPLGKGDGARSVVNSASSNGLTGN
jgi:hypothetical protein